MVIVLVLVYGIKTIRGWFGIGGGKKNEKTVNLKLPDDVKALFPNLEKKLEKFVRRFREELTETYYMPLSFVNRCALYKEALANLTTSEISIVAQAYEAGYKESLIDGIKEAYSGCVPVVMTDYKAQLIKELEKI